ncbi:hypothetical protein C4577_04905 [Candidatus Parcubacteria bacterium]|nr:MAG: hypothetical protein C4577_04905 [Candidatus Parcubacteria bacterium]
MNTEEGQCFICKHDKIVRISETPDWLPNSICWECDITQLRDMKRAAMVFGAMAVCLFFVLVTRMF